MCVVNTSVQVEFDVPVEKAPKEEVARQLDLNEVVEGTANADEYKYYRLKVVDPHSAVKIVVEPVSGDPDLYVSTKINNPTQISHMWKAQRHGRNELIIDPSHKDFSSVSHAMQCVCVRVCV